jgi:hypothetical protein
VPQAARESDEQGTPNEPDRSARGCATTSRANLMSSLQERAPRTVRSSSRVAPRAPAGAPRAIAAAAVACGGRAKNASSSDGHRRVLRGFFFFSHLIN